MINFPEIFGQGILGQGLRRLLSLIPAQFIIKIKQGPNKGFQWVKGAGVNGYWLGTYEPSHQKFLSEKIKPSAVFYDVGAHVGFFSLMASRLTGSNGVVIAFEPLTRNAQYLKKHIELNQIKNIRLIEKAVSDQLGEFGFQPHESSSMGRLDQTGYEKVQVTTIDELVFKEKLPPPHLIKIDVEGFQENVLLGALQTLKMYSPAIILEAQYDQTNPQNFSHILGNLGYQIFPLNTDSLEKAGDFFCSKET